MSDDRADAIGDDVERYEQLRAGALAGAPGSGLGLALLRCRGLGAWARAWPIARPVPAARPVPLAAGAEQIVDVLAEMALACITRTGG